MQAVTAIRDSEARKKIEEALQLLDLARKPERLLDSATSADVRTFFGVPNGWAKLHDTSDYNIAGALRTQWTEHCKRWDRDRADKSIVGDRRPTPRDVNEYWRSLRDRSPDLSLLAEHHWAAASSSQPERVFSILTTMDVPNRRKMEELTLANTLFLRANKTTVNAIAQEMQADINSKTSSHVTARAAEGKSKAARLAEAASTAGFAAMEAAIAARTACTPGHKRSRDNRVDDSESESGDSASDSPLLESGDDELSD